MNKPSTRLLFSAAVISVLAFGSRADAAFMMTLDDGVNPLITIVDGGPGDDSPLMGVILFSGATDGLAFSNITGTSKPLSGGPNRAQLDISGVHVAGEEGGGSLVISLSDTDFTLTGTGAATLLSSIGGTAGLDGTVLSESFLDLDNNIPYVSGPTTTIGPLSTLAFAELTQTGFTYGGDPFSMVRVVTVNVGADETLSYNAFSRATAVPEPATMAYLGLSLGVLGLRRRRRSA